METNIREMRNKLLMQSINLRKVSSTTKGDKGFELRKKQDEIYKKWEFYDKLIKAKIKEDKE